MKTLPFDELEMRRYKLDDFINFELNMRCALCVAPLRPISRAQKKPHKAALKNIVHIIKKYFCFLRQNKI